MWLRNYYNFLTAALGEITASTSTSTPTDYSQPIRVRKPSGAYATTRYGKPTTSSLDAMSYFGKLLFKKSRLVLFTSETPAQTLNGILFGSGSTPVTYDDYTLDTPILSGLTLIDDYGIVKTETSFDDDTHAYSGGDVQYTITNSSASTITIREFGLYHSDNEVTATLVYREVLDEAIVLAPSESVILSFAVGGPVINYTPY